MDIEKKVRILLNILQVLCELAERDATFFLPQKGNEIDYLLIMINILVGYVQNVTGIHAIGAVKRFI